MSATARTMAWLTGSVSMSRMKLPSILMMSIGRFFRYANDDMPTPKSSSAVLQPTWRSCSMKRATRDRLRTATVSVISKHTRDGATPCFFSKAMIRSASASSSTLAPDRLIVASRRSAPAGCNWSKCASAVSTTQRSSIGIRL